MMWKPLISTRIFMLALRWVLIVVICVNDFYADHPAVPPDRLQWAAVILTMGGL
jgi:hypothetical protein